MKEAPCLKKPGCIPLNLFRVLRPGRHALTDVGAMFRIINHYADRQRMLPKTMLQLYENLRDYSVAVDASAKNILGCGALHIYWENLAEIRALAVAPDGFQGIGTSIVETHRGSS